MESFDKEHDATGTNLRLLVDGLEAGCVQLHRLSLAFCELSPIAPTLARYLARFCPDLLHLDVGDSCSEDANEDVWAALVCVLVASCPKLQTLHVSSNRIGAAGAEALACQLSQTCHELRTLDMRGNCVGAAGAGALGRHLADGCRELRELTIHGNKIGAAGAEALARHLAAGCCRLQKLGMLYNPMGQAGAVAVARCVATGCPELQELDLFSIRDGGEAVDAKVLEAAVKAELGPLKDTCTLSISW